MTRVGVSNKGQYVMKKGQLKTRTNLIIDKLSPLQTNMLFNQIVLGSYTSADGLIDMARRMSDEQVEAFKKAGEK